MFHSLKIFTVHIKPGRDDAAHTPQFVREGFNIFAFAFTILWALYHRVWRLAGIIMLTNIALALLAQQGFLHQASFAVAQLAVNLLIGFHANDFHRAQLARRGYVLSDITTGDSLLRAEQRYFDRLVA
jgi:bacteriorhodopsin